MLNVVKRYIVKLSLLILSATSKVRDHKMSNKYDNRLPFSKLFERKFSNQLSTVLILILSVSLPRDVQPKFESSSNYDTMVENNYLLKKALSMYPSSVWVYKDRFPTLRHLLLEKDDLDKSIHNRQSPRLGKNMEKVHRGENIKILLIGVVTLLEEDFRRMRTVLMVLFIIY